MDQLGQKSLSMVIAIKWLVFKIINLIFGIKIILLLFELYFKGNALWRMFWFKICSYFWMLETNKKTLNWPLINTRSKFKFEEIESIFCKNICERLIEWLYLGIKLKKKILKQFETFFSPSVPHPETSSLVAFLGLPTPPSLCLWAFSKALNPLPTYTADW